MSKLAPLLLLLALPQCRGPKEALEPLPDVLDDVAFHEAALQLDAPAGFEADADADADAGPDVDIDDSAPELAVDAATDVPDGDPPSPKPCPWQPIDEVEDGTTSFEHGTGAFPQPFLGTGNGPFNASDACPRFRFQGTMHGGGASKFATDFDTLWVRNDTSAPRRLFVRQVAVEDAPGPVVVVNYGGVERIEVPTGSNGAAVDLAPGGDGYIVVSTFGPLGPYTIELEFGHVAIPSCSDSGSIDGLVLPLRTVLGRWASQGTARDIAGQIRLPATASDATTTPVATIDGTPATVVSHSIVDSERVIDVTASFDRRSVSMAPGFFDAITPQRQSLAIRVDATALIGLATAPEALFGSWSLEADAATTARHLVMSAAGPELPAPFPAGWADADVEPSLQPKVAALTDALTTRIADGDTTGVVALWLEDQHPTFADLVALLNPDGLATPTLGSSVDPAILHAVNVPVAAAEPAIWRVWRPTPAPLPPLSVGLNHLVFSSPSGAPNGAATEWYFPAGQVDSWRLSYTLPDGTTVFSEAAAGVATTTIEGPTVDHVATLDGEAILVVRGAPHALVGFQAYWEPSMQVCRADAQGHAAVNLPKNNFMATLEDSRWAAYAIDTATGTISAATIRNAPNPPFWPAPAP